MSSRNDNRLPGHPGRKTCQHFGEEGKERKWSSMAEMKTDAATLAQEAGNFERISGDLKTQIDQVESTAGSLQGQWRGAAGTAAQAAVVRFQEAANKQKQKLDEISTNIRQAGVQYSRADEEQQQALSSQMGF